MSRNLPAILGEIEEIAGLPAALAVAEAVGGTRAYIPRRPGADHWLVRAVGIEVATKIVEHFTTGQTGVELVFPAGPAATYNKQQRQRARQISELNAQGLSSGKIARQAGVSQRAVHRFRAQQRERADDPQGDLGL